jgi:hypothetical protein
MKFELKAVTMCALVATAVLLAPTRALAQNPPPGAIFDLSTVNPGSLSTYTQFTTSFVADNSSEDVSFAFREVPAFFSFDDACVTATTCASSNLLSDPGFEASSGVIGSNFPVGWDRWIQPVDTSAIGEVDSSGYGCGANAHSGSVFWCDGSVQGFDALYQNLTGLIVGDTYTISFWLDDNSGQAINNPNIDMLVYAGDDIPVGSIPIGTTPEPSTLIMIGTGLLGVGGAIRRRFLA